MLHTKSMFNCWEQHLHGRYQSLVIINTIKNHPKNKNEHHLPKNKNKTFKSRNVMIKNKQQSQKASELYYLLPI